MYTYGHTKPVEKDTSVQLVEQFTSGMNEGKALRLSLLFYALCAVFQSLLNLFQQCRFAYWITLSSSLLPSFLLKTYIAVNTQHWLCLYISEYSSSIQMRKLKSLEKCYWRYKLWRLLNWLWRRVRSWARWSWFLWLFTGVYHGIFLNEIKLSKTV